MIKHIVMCFVVDVIIVVSISGGAFVFLQKHAITIPAHILNHNSKYAPPLSPNKQNK